MFSGSEEGDPCFGLEKRNIRVSPLLAHFTMLGNLGVDSRPDLGKGDKDEEALCGLIAGQSKRAFSVDSRV